jgi:hypothetical protein
MCKPRAGPESIGHNGSGRRDALFPHWVAPDLAIGHHVAQLGREFAVTDGADSLPSVTTIPSGLFDDRQRDPLAFLGGSRLVLRLIAAIDLRVLKGVRQEQVVAHAERIGILQVFAEVGLGVFGDAQFVFGAAQRRLYAATASPR